MLRGILNRALGGRRRPAGGTTAGPAAGRPAGGSANRDIEQGAKSLIRGLSKKRGRGL